MAGDPQVFELKCSIQKYAWGKLGEDSAVAQLCHSNDSAFEISPDTPYAELWMGTHPNGPSVVVIPEKPEISLDDWIKANPDKLGSEIKSYFDGQLPFLFKVLSVETSLSIQAHPNKVCEVFSDRQVMSLQYGILSERNDSHMSHIRKMATKSCLRCGDVTVLFLCGLVCTTLPASTDRTVCDCLSRILRIFSTVQRNGPHVYVLAQELHTKLPDVYKDSNHKPELAIALTPFQGLCGFRPIKEVAQFIQDIDAFRTVVGAHNAVKLVSASSSMDMPLHREAMKTCFTGLMSREADIVKEELANLIEFVEEKEFNGKDISPYVGKELLKLHREFPGDRGAFAIYFLNVITLQPGEAMFLDANLPHAYLSGDCMECMACSDNVVRAGLTNKFIDVHTLCEMLEYTSQPISRSKFKGITRKEGDVSITHFKPMVPDFSVYRYQIPSGVTTCKLAPLKSASICIVISGSGEASNATLSSPLSLTKGSVFFVSAQQEVQLKVASDGMLMFRSCAGL